MIAEIKNTVSDIGFFMVWMAMVMVLICAGLAAGALIAAVVVAVVVLAGVAGLGVFVTANRWPICVGAVAVTGILVIWGVA